MHKIKNDAFTILFNFFLSLTDEPIFLFFQLNPLCIYSLIGNCVRVKSLGLVLRLANAQPLGNAKFANANVLSGCP